MNEGFTAAIQDRLSKLMNESVPSDKRSSVDERSALEGLDSAQSVLEQSSLVQPTSEEEERIAAFLYAAEVGATHDVQDLLLKGVNVDVSYEGITALMLAAQNGHLAVLKLLIKAHANLDRVAHGVTAIMHAVHQGHIGAVNLLTKHGANVEVVNEEGFTVLLLAVKLKLTDTVKHLALNANLEARDNKEFTPLMIAVETGDIHTMRVLLEAGADPEAITSEGFTALMIAAQNGHLECVQALLARGIPQETRDVHGYTALGIADYYQQTAVSNLLREGTEKQKANVSCRRISK